jgi:hypothetical protein
MKNMEDMLVRSRYFEFLETTCWRRAEANRQENNMRIDLHGYHPADIVFNGTLGKIVQQVWEMGESDLTLIHGHGRNRGISPGFVNTNTGYFGLCIRHAFRHDKSLRQWISYTTLDCRQMGCTSIRLKTNPEPTRKQIDCF